MIYLFLAPGFEEIEALATLDVLRRAELDVKTVGIGDRIVTGSHGITVHSDLEEEQAVTDGLEMLVLPGGMPGTKNLDESRTVDRLLLYAAQQDLWLAAICAAPLVLGRRGLLQGKRATCFPGYEEELQGARVCADRVVRDGRIITGKGAGAAIPFALEIVRALCGSERAAALEASMQ